MGLAVQIPTGSPPVWAGEIVNVKSTGGATDALTIRDTVTGRQASLRVNATGIEVLNNAFSGQALGLDDSGQLHIKADVQFDNPTTTVGSPAAGGAGALPATPLGYLRVNLAGTTRVIPFY